MKRTISILFLWILLPGFSAQSPASNGVVPFKLYREHLIVAKCSVEGLPELTAIIDTGASETVLDIGLARRLSLATQDDNATLLTQETRVWTVTIPGLQLGPLKAERLAGIAADLSSLTGELGIRPQVLIGMDLLRRTNFVIDYQARQLIFGVAARLRHSTRLVAGGPDSHFAVIESTVMRKTLRLQVDSGFNSLLLYGNRPGNLTALAGRESRVASGAQTLLARSFDSLDLQIGDWRAHGIQISVVDGAPRDFAAFDGVIGTQVLSKRRVAFDFENQMISWE